MLLFIDDAKDRLIPSFVLLHYDGLGLDVSVLHDGSRAAVMRVSSSLVHLLDETGDLEHPAIDLVLE